VRSQTRPTAHNSQVSSRLLEAGQTLFSSQGYSATSMRQVAEKAGLALAGIYNHFSSKEAIFEVILLEYNPFQRGSLRPLTETIDRQQAKVLLDEMGKEPEFFNLILIELLEFKGKHLPILFEKISGNAPPPASWRILISMVISYHVTHILLTSTSLAGTQTQISPDTLMDYLLNGILESE
jgi:AcrR family transcriptional regulator